MHMEYVFHNKFGMIFHDQKTISLNFKSNRSQMFFKIGVLKNFAIFTGKRLRWITFNKVAGLEDCNFITKRLQQVFSSEYCEIFKNTYFEEHLRTAASVLLIIKLVVSIGHLQTFSFNKKHNMEWFLLRRFVDMIRAYSLLIISRNHSNTFLLINLQKKSCPK